jgi:hypothetical protein
MIDIVTHILIKLSESREDAKFQCQRAADKDNVIANLERERDEARERVMTLEQKFHDLGISTEDCPF